MKLLSLFYFTFFFFAFAVANVELSNNVKVAIMVPVSHADAVRNAIGNAGAGRFGSYDFCSTSTKVTGYWRANKGSNPAIGKIGVLESTPEEKIEFICPKELLKEVLEAAKQVHPYEVMGYDIFPLLEIN